MNPLLLLGLDLEAIHRGPLVLLRRLVIARKAVTCLAIFESSEWVCVGLKSQCILLIVHIAGHLKQIFAWCVSASSWCYQWGVAQLH